MSNSASLVYEGTPQNNTWPYLVKVIILVLTTVLVILAVYYVDWVKNWIVPVVFGFPLIAEVIIFQTLTIERYQIFQDKVRIVLDRPFAFNIPLSTVREARPVRGWKSFACGGFPLVTSLDGVEIVRRKSLNVVISPSDKDVFLEHLNQALRTLSTSH